MKPATWVAIYAAIVGTGALLLNFKNWFDGRVRLHQSPMPDARLSDGDLKELMAVTVTNRGGSPTTITHLFILEFPSLWRRYRIKPGASFFIPNLAIPGTPYQIPFELGPAKLWTGISAKQYDQTPNLHNGRHYIAVYASHRNRPYLVRIPTKATTLPDTSKTLS
jgi:hypothetical protein